MRAKSGRAGPGMRAGSGIDAGGADASRADGGDADRPARTPADTPAGIPTNSPASIPTNSPASIPVNSPGGVKSLRRSFGRNFVNTFTPRTPSARAAPLHDAAVTEFLSAYWISSALLRTRRCSIIVYLWNATVRGETLRMKAASFIERPSASSCSTSLWRSVS